VASEQLPGLFGNIGDGIAAAIQESPLTALGIAPFLAICWRNGPEFVHVPGDPHVGLVVE
jgi:hypothetical protein